MKRARPSLLAQDIEEAAAFLTTSELARVLRVHPKHVYRLLRSGLPGHRIGGEWRFIAEEVRRWSAGRGRKRAEPLADADTGAVGPAAPALLAANGDVAVELLLVRLSEAGPLFGHVQADRGGSLELLQRGAVLAAGCHGEDIPAFVGQERLAFIRLVERQVVLAMRRGARFRGLRHLARLRLASRPPSAGVRHHFDIALRREGLDPAAVHAGASVLGSHREVVCAVVRREADVGLASAAWAARVGLESAPLCRETYGLLVRASNLGDPRVVRLCELAQSGAFRKELGGVAGYEARRSGAIIYEPVRAGGSP
ncbi:MAG: helix-turn-helix transcriptional regulator [Myxococcales bacterium]|nr:helix-turn-helix transcriptional regulator [Myxococcales bacterium]